MKIEPSWSKLPWDAKTSATDAQIAAWEREAADCDAAARVEYERRKALYDQIYERARELWSFEAHRAVFAAMKKRKPVHPGDRWAYALRDLRGQIVRAREIKAKESADRERFAKAVVWLVARGKQIGDYDPIKAVEVANGLAMDEEIAKRLRDDEWHTVPGDHDDDCRGWDGKSYRCECGAARPSWEADFSHSFESPGVHPELC